MTRNRLFVPKLHDLTPGGMIPCVYLKDSLTVHWLLCHPENITRQRPDDM